jgi:hypothetical protein
MLLHMTALSIDWSLPSDFMDYRTRSLSSVFARPNSIDMTLWFQHLGHAPEWLDALIAKKLDPFQ